MTVRARRSASPAGALVLGLVAVTCATRPPTPGPPVAAPAPATALPPQQFVEHATVEAFQDPERRAKLAATFPALDAALAREVAAQKLPGLAFGIVIDGELAYAKGLGVRDLETKQPVDADTIFRIGSITKTFTGMAILRGVAVIVLSNYIEANLQPFLRDARELLLASGGLAPRVRPVSPVLARTMASLLDLYGNFRDDLYREVYAPVWRFAFPKEDTVRDADRVRKKHGTCRAPHATEVRSSWSGRFLAACDRGAVDIDIQLDAAGRIVDVFVESRDTPAPPKCPEPPASPK
jgi:hypothetical protein